MNTADVTRKYRKQADLTLKAFGDAITESMPDKSFTKQAVMNWERGVQSPNSNFLILVAARYNDWRRNWALDCLSVLLPDVFKPASPCQEPAQ